MSARLVAAAAALVVLAACSSTSPPASSGASAPAEPSTATGSVTPSATQSGSIAPSATGSPPSEPSPTGAVPTGGSPSGPTSTPSGHVILQAVGAFVFEVNGFGATCTYLDPVRRSGFVYSASSSAFPGTGTWEFRIEGSSPTDVRATFNTAQGSFANDAAGGNGSITAFADLHHADFNLDLVGTADRRVVVRVRGSIDCP